MANKNTKTVAESVEDSESAKALDQEIEQADLLADVKGILPEPGKLRIRAQNELMKISLELMPMFEEMYEVDENGERVLDENGDAVVREDVERSEYLVAMFDATAKIDEFVESIALDRDAYVSWSEGKSHAHFMALLNYYRRVAGE